MNKSKLPRNHAFIHFRNASMLVELDFPRVDEPFVDEMRKLAIERWIERNKAKDAAKANPSSDPTDTEIIDFMEARAREEFGGGGAWSDVGMSGPVYGELDSETFIYPTLRDSVKAEMLQSGWKRQQPKTWDPSKASMDLEHSLLRATAGDSEPDEPVVTEVPRG